MFTDIRFAFRQLRRSPVFAVTATLTLALGIGAATAIFTLFDEVLLRALPVADPQQLVRMDWHGSFSGSMSAFGGDIGNYYSYPMYEDLREENRVFSGMLAAVKSNVGVNWHNQAEDEDAELVSGNYFEVLGVRPFAGRLFDPSDETQKNANAVAVLSYDYWRTHFGASRSVIGQSVTVNGHPFEIVGVAPEGFHTVIGGYRPRLFLPVTEVEVAIPWTVTNHRLDNHQSLWLTIVARLKPGVSMAQAQASITPLWHALRLEEVKLYSHASQRFIEGYTTKSSIEVIDDSLGFSPNRGDLRMPLVILLGMAGLLLTMCGLNVATLLLLRSAARVREMSMRYALGAGSSRIVLQLLLEGGVLGALGAAAGLMFSQMLAHVLVRLMTNSEPGNEPYSAHLDGHVLAFALAATVATSVLFSLAPALHYLHPDLAGALRQTAGTASKRTQIFRKAAVGLQIALSVLLLGGAGLFVRTLVNLRDQPVGFDTRGMATFYLDPTSSGYGDQQTSAIVKTALEKLARIPGVQSVAGNTDPELENSTEWNGFVIQGHKFAEGESTDFESLFVTPRYFATIRQPLLAGRDFTLADGLGAPKVAIVNLAFANKFYGSADNALGRLIGDDHGSGSKADTTIVGVVGDTRHADLRTKMGPGVYEPYLQMKHPVGVQIYVRSIPNPEAVELPIRQTMRDLDPTLVVDGLRTMEAQVDITAADQRALAMLALGFAGLAGLLAAVGLYGVLSYSIQGRTREIGVRLALGSPRRRVVGLVVGEMAWIAGAGIVVALPGTVVLAHCLRSQLYGVSPFDPISLTCALGLAIVMVALASVLPARRATAVEPVVALRNE